MKPLCRGSLLAERDQLRAVGGGGVAALEAQGRALILDMDEQTVSVFGLRQPGAVDHRLELQMVQDGVEVAAQCDGVALLLLALGDIEHSGRHRGQNDGCNQGAQQGQAQMQLFKHRSSPAGSRCRAPS